jgi:ABC-2 type transport system ATP-binding protein
MPDFSPVYENLKVWEYLEVFAAAYLIPRDERINRARHWIEQVTLTEKWNTYIRDLSGGMRQRLVLAKTLLHDPKIILLDEPASGLDPIGRIEMRDILKNQAEKGKTIIISSHILTELSDFCNAIGIMEKGKMVVSGTIDMIRATIGSKGQLIIHILNTSEQIKQLCLALLTQSPVVSNVKEVTTGEFHAVFLGDKKDSAALLESIVKQNIPVEQFFIKEANVEDIFFKIGAREVS